MKKRAFAIILLAVIPLLLSGCTSGQGFTVVTTFYPLYVATINVTRDVPGVSVSCLAPPQAGCLHDYQMTTADRRAIDKANALVMNGSGLETFLDTVLPELKALVIDASAGAHLLQGEHGANPHIWVGIDGMILETMNIARGLSELDAAHAEQYDANARAYVDKLAALRNQMADALAPYQGEPIVTFHEAFAYFAQAFSLRVVAVVEKNEGSAPSARELADVAETIRAEGVAALFVEPQYTDASADVLARETGLPLYTLDPAVSGNADPTDYDGYLHIMQKNLEVLLEAFQ